MYSSVGTQLGFGNGFSGQNLIQVVSGTDLEKRIAGFAGKDVIAIFNHQPDRQVNGAVGLQFKRGVFKILSDRLDWGNRHDQFETIYDIVDVSSIKFRGGFNGTSPNVYTFFAGAGDEEETIKVIHVDPVLAYSFVKGKAVTTRHGLKSVDPIAPGMMFYEHKDD